MSRWPGHRVVILQLEVVGGGRGRSATCLLLVVATILGNNGVLLSLLLRECIRAAVLRSLPSITAPGNALFESDIDSIVALLRWSVPYTTGLEEAGRTTLLVALLVVVGEEDTTPMCVEAGRPNSLTAVSPPPEDEDTRVPPPLSEYELGMADTACHLADVGVGMVVVPTGLLPTLPTNLAFRAVATDSASFCRTAALLGRRGW